MSHLDRPAVKRVRDALLAAGLEDTVMELAASARTAELPISRIQATSTPIRLPINFTGQVTASNRTKRRSA